MAACCYNWSSSVARIRAYLALSHHETNWRIYRTMEQLRQHLSTLNEKIMSVVERL